MGNSNFILVTNSESKDHLLKKFSQQNDIEFKNFFYSVPSLVDTLVENGVIFLRAIKGILVLDYAFTSTKDIDRAMELLTLQDALKSQGVQDVKLYVITKDADLLRIMKHNVMDGGMPAIYYENTQVFGVEKVTYKVILKVLKGELDKKGLYHPDLDKPTSIQRLAEDTQHFIDGARALNKEVKEYGTVTPISEFSKSDFVDTPQFQRKLENEKRKAEKEKREAELKRKQEERKAKETTVSKKRDVSPVIDSGGGGTTTVIKGSNRAKQPPVVEEEDKSFRLVDDEDITSGFNIDISKMRSAFKGLGQDNKLVSNKLRDDKGVIFVTGIAKSGVSGFISNSADMYALAGKRVCVIDLDLIGRAQTRYFPTYDDKVLEYYGRSNGLLDVAKGSDISRSAVQITSRISVLGVSRKEDLLDNELELLSEMLRTIIDDARSVYDIVLVDCPFNKLGYFFDNVLEANHSIFIVPNKWYEIETFIDRELLTVLVGVGEDDFDKLMKKSSFVLNKFDKRNMDVNGEPVNKAWLKDKLLDKGYPYDTVSVLGEIPFYENWENQYKEGVRYVLTDNLAIGVYNLIWCKVVV